MYNDPYNPEQDPNTKPEFTNGDTKEIAPGWEDVAAEANSETAPPAIGSPESYHYPRGTIGEDLDALRSYMDNANELNGEASNIVDASDDTVPETSTADSTQESTSQPEEVPDEAEVEARFREYVKALESELNSVRNMSNDGLRRNIREEIHSLKQQLSGANNADAPSRHDLMIDLAVRRRAEAVLQKQDEL